ncbi:hypothetical protein [Kamptonema formosum]|uniref:hypothetical protein n=1 Tax=Kamptonema formosum TaxID=331992 RepID=UPI0012DED7AC|nr:hypothetical protein [Oscillatoria sp. PCC 10802]
MTTAIYAPGGHRRRQKLPIYPAPGGTVELWGARAALEAGAGAAIVRWKCRLLWKSPRLQPPRVAGAG